MAEEQQHTGDQPDPLTADDEAILDKIMATFTEEDMDEWARQLDEEAQPKGKEPAK